MSRSPDLDAPNLGIEADEVTRDAFLGGRLTLLQPRRGPRAAIDGVLLSAAIPAGEGLGQRALDAGTGTGIVALALAHRIGDIHVTGIERQPELAHLAAENARINDLDGRVRFVTADLTARLGELEALGLVRESFHHVAANPPFYADGTARASETASRRQAHMADVGALEAWFRFLAAVTLPGGTVTLIHRPEALADILAATEGRFGALVVYPLFPGPDAAAIRILVQGVKASRAPLSLSPGLVLHRASGAYSDEADAILRGDAILPLAEARG